MEEKKEAPQPEQKTYAEKIEEKKEEIKKNAFKKAQEKSSIPITEEDRRWAEKTVGLIHNEEFKHYLELENLCLMEIMITAYKPPPETWFKSDKFGEQMAFKAGMDAGLKRLKNKREHIWHSYLLAQKQEKEKSDG